MTQHPVDHRKLWLEQLVKDNNFTQGAELGVHEGVTHFHLLDSCPNLNMIGVDIYTGKQSKWWDSVSSKLTEYGDRSKFYKMDTVAAAKKVPDQSLDFIFIDAGHAYENVIADLRAWYPKIRSGGYVTGHDCNHPGVKRAIDEFLVNGYSTAQDEVWYCQK